MNFNVTFSDKPVRFCAQFSEDDQSFEGFGKDLQLVHGKDGGHYIPKVTQTGPGTIEFAFEPSEEKMPEVDPVEVILPTGEGGTSFIPDSTLTLKDGVLGVNTADKVGASTLPVTAAAVDTVVGNIEVLLGTI